MSVTAPRCHLCLEPKRVAASGFLVCDHCDTLCTAGTPKARCPKCEQGDKAEGRGPR